MITTYVLKILLALHLLLPSAMLPQNAVFLGANYTAASGGGYSIIQATGSGSTCTTGTSCQFNITSTGSGHSGFVLINSWDGAAPGFSAITDSASETYAKVGCSTGVSSHGLQCLYWIQALASGVTNVKVTLTSSGDQGDVFLEVSGILVGLDQDAGFSSGPGACGNSTCTSATTATTTYASELLVGDIISGGHAYTATNGWTVQVQGSTPSNGVQYGGFTKTVSATGAYNLTASGLTINGFAWIATLH